MRRFIGQNRLIHNEATAGLRDAPGEATFVFDGATPIVADTLEVGCDPGTVYVVGTETSVSGQTESVADIGAGEYRYHTLAIDATGALVVESSPIGEFDPENPSAEPDPQVVEPAHPEGSVYLGSAIQFDAGIDRVYDGRLVVRDVPNETITQGEGSGLDADTVRGATAWTDENDGEGSGLDADLLRGAFPLPNASLVEDTISVTGGANVESSDESTALGGTTTIDVAPQGEGSGLDADSVDGSDADELSNNRVPVHDIEDGSILIDSDTQLDRENDGSTYTGIGGSRSDPVFVTTWDAPTPDFSDRVAANFRVSGSWVGYDPGGSPRATSLELRDQAGNTLIRVTDDDDDYPFVTDETFTIERVSDVAEYTGETLDLYMGFSNDDADVTVDFFEWEQNHTVNSYIEPTP